MESLGNDYEIVSGLPERNDKHASILADLALQFVANIANFYIPHMPDEKIQLRIGLHSGGFALQMGNANISGPMIAGVVGLSMSRFFMWGDSIGVAIHLQETSKGVCLALFSLYLRSASCIHISEETQKFLVDGSCKEASYILKPRGEIIVKRYGPIFTYWLLGKSASNIADHTNSSTDGSCISRPNKRSVGGVETDATSLNPSEDASKSVQSVNKSNPKVNADTAGRLESSISLTSSDNGRTEAVKPLRKLKKGAKVSTVFVICIVRFQQHGKLQSAVIDPPVAPQRPSSDLVKTKANVMLLDDIE